MVLRQEESNVASFCVDLTVVDVSCRGVCEFVGSGCLPIDVCVFAHVAFIWQSCCLSCCKCCSAYNIVHYLKHFSAHLSARHCERWALCAFEKKAVAFEQKGWAAWAKGQR